MKKRWIQVALVMVAAVAGGFGVYGMRGHGSSPNTDWLTAAAKNGAGNVAGLNMAAGNLTGNNAGDSTGNNAGNDAGNQADNQTQANAQIAGAGSTTSHSVAAAGTQASSKTKAAAGPAPVPPSPPTFTIVVSENNGKTLISRKKVALVKGESLMDYMKQNYVITTTYGGDFMVSINGIASQWNGVPANQRQPVDWFLYVNKMEAPVGASDIIPRSGDTDTWDYHRWDPATGRG